MATDKAKILLRSIVIIALMISVISAVINYKNLKQNDLIIPFVAPGTYKIFSGEMNKSAVITDIDATSKYIYFAYYNCVVAVYDWNGAYQYSIAFSRPNHGVLYIRCEGDLLYVSDREDYEFVFSGDTNINKLFPYDERHYKVWFTEKRDVPIAIQNNKIYDKSDKYIMDLPGTLR